MSYRGRYQQSKPHKANKKGGKTAVVMLAAVAVLLIAGVVGGVVYYNSMLNKIPRAEVVDKNLSQEELDALFGKMVTTEPRETVEEVTQETAEAATVPETHPDMKPEDIINVLVVGQSARKGESGHLADSTILVTINTYTDTVTLSSVLRDALVERGGSFMGRTYGGGKFTQLYAWAYAVGDIGGAMQCYNQAMLDNFGVEVDHNFEVDFDIFMDFINNLGGVGLELTQAEADYINDDLGGYCNVEEGYNWMDGYMTLSYARMRKAEGDNDSDIKRTARQRYLVERILHQVTKKSLPEIQEIVEKTLPYLITNMENEEITKLLTDVLPILPNLKIESGTLPVEGTGKGEMKVIYEDTAPESVIRFTPEQQKKIMAPITEGVTG